MIAALRYEWVRVTTIRSTKIVMVLAVIFGAGLGYLVSSPNIAYDSEGVETVTDTIDWWGAFGYPLTLVVVLASVVGAQSIGQEYRFGLIRLTLTAFPQRVRVLVAKLLVVVGASVVLVLASFLGSFIAVSLRGHPLPAADVVAPDSTYLLRGVAYVVLWGLSAFAIAGVSRQTAVGIAVPIISGLIVEQLLSAFLYDRARWLTDILPWSTASRWLSTMSADGEFTDPEGIAMHIPPQGWAALGVFGVWVAVFLATETVAFLRRDA